MYNHEPDGYPCPFCRIVREANVQRNLCESASDIIFQTDSTTAFLALGHWTNNPVDVLVVPNQHFENLYDFPQRLVPAVHQMTRAVALTLKAVYQCDGISTRQHNELAGDQDVWHYHVHVTPRFTGDNFYRSRKVRFPEVDRLAHAKRLREYLTGHIQELF